MAEGDSNKTASLEHGPMDQFTAHIDRGWDLVNRGDLRGAELSADKSLELDGQAPEAHNLLGYVKAAQGQAEDALEHYKQALALDDTFVEAMLNAAEVLIHPLHDFDAAVDLIDEALDFAENDDERADALLLKYDAHMHQGDKDGAIRVAASLPEGPFESARLDFLVGRAHFETGRAAESKRLLESATAREPQNADAHYTLALVHEAAGDERAKLAAFLRTRDMDLALQALMGPLARDDFEGRVKATLEKLPAPMRAVLADAQVVVAELPGAEVVADGIDPRVAVLLDATSRDTRSRKASKVARMFVYQRNVERNVEDPAELDEELYFVIEDELCAMFPDLAPFATAVPEDHDH